MDLDINNRVSTSYTLKACNITFLSFYSPLPLFKIMQWVGDQALKITETFSYVQIDCILGLVKIYFCSSSNTEMALVIPHCKINSIA